VYEEAPVARRSLFAFARHRRLLHRRKALPLNVRNGAIDGTMLTEAICLTLFPTMMAFAASSDLFTMTIANRVSLILVAGFIVLALLTGTDAVEIASHFAAGAVVLIVAFTLFSRGWIGGGDAKLAAATALWFGFAHLLDYLLYASIFGGVLTVLLVWFRMLPLPQLLASREWIERLHHRGGGVPYGIALAAGALVVYPHTQWMALSSL
jgi:prepilin peptidase CpaA